ncbi:MAG: zinc metallopeptidase [Synoicihabitans sp.]
MLWLLLFIGPMLFGLYAQNKIRTAYSKNVRIGSRGRISGYEAAQAVMRSAGINDVEIVQVPGELTDHYDPIRKRLALSEQNYRGSSLAAVGVAAHEAGHAIQHKVGYSMMKVRQTMVPATQIASTISSWVMMGGIFLLMFAGASLGYNLLTVGAVALAVIVLFQLVTLPVEFDATRRAKTQLVELGILDRDEMEGVNETLDAAALTYVAAFVAALGSLLHVLMILQGRRD